MYVYVDAIKDLTVSKFQLHKTRTYVLTLLNIINMKCIMAYT